MSYTVKWFEIPIADPDRAQTFYESILNIKMQRLDIGEVLVLILFPGEEGNSVGALAYHPQFYFPGAQGTLIYLNAVPSIEIVLSRVQQTGQQILIPKRLISAERGYMAVIQDTEGNRIAFMSPNG